MKRKRSPIWALHAGLFERHADEIARRRRKLGIIIGLLALAAWLVANALAYEIEISTWLSK